MYEIIRPAYDVMGPGVDERRTVPEERRTFHTGAGLLRWALNERLLEHRTGGVPYPRRFDDKWLGRPGDRWGGYGMIDTFCRWRFTPEAREAMQRAQMRYAEIMHYRREVEPEWRPDVEYAGNAEGRVYYADNSVVVYQINKYGKRRHVTEVAPGGDACF